MFRMMIALLHKRVQEGRRTLGNDPEPPRVTENPYRKNNGVIV